MDRNKLETITQSSQQEPSTPEPPPTPLPPPTHSSHDVTPKWASALSNITAHKAGETATDKPDECFAALRAEDARATQVLIAGGVGQIFFFPLNQLLQCESFVKALVRFKNGRLEKDSQLKWGRQYVAQDLTASSNRIPCC